MRNWPFMVFKLLLPPLVCATLAFSQGSGLPARETLYYSIDWRLFTAGKARVELTTSALPRPGYQANLRLESTGIVSKLFKVEDDYSSNMNSAFCAQTLQMTTHEGNRLRETKIAFDAEAKKASYLERDRARNNAIVLSQETDIPSCVHDVIGGLFFIRTLNLERDRARNNAIVLSQETDIPSCVHDVIGGLFFIRTLNLEPGQSTQIPVS